MAKQKKSIENAFKPFNSLEKSTNFTPENRDISAHSPIKKYELNTLDTLLTIRN